MLAPMKLLALHTQATARVQRQQPEVRMTEIEAHMATYVWFVQLGPFNSRLLTTV